MQTPILRILNRVGARLNFFIHSFPTSLTPRGSHQGENRLAAPSTKRGGVNDGECMNPPDESQQVPAQVVSERTNPVNWQFPPLG